MNNIFDRSWSRHPPPTPALTCPLWGDEVEILDVLPECLDILVDGVGGDAANLD